MSYVTVSNKASKQGEVKMKSDPEKVWKCILYSATLYPGALPKEYKKIDVIKGNGNSVDSVRVVHFADGWGVKSAMEEIKEVDTGNKKIKYVLVGGDLRKYYKSVETKLQVSPCSDVDEDDEPFEAVVNWSTEAEKVKQNIPYPNFLEGINKATFEDLDVFLNGHH